MQSDAPPGPVAEAFAAAHQAWEDEHLSPRAARSYPARRAHDEPDCGLRTPLQRDRDRIVHSKAFRRLSHKTQVFIAPRGDHYRTRLTHTLEVTQIARTVARALALNEDLVEAIGLGHDLGHTPFGHVGEEFLDLCLRERYGTGFRHYEHSVRIVEVLERDYAGLNLVADVIAGIAGHSGRAHPPATLEGRIVRVVDRVAYLNHDIDDAIRAGVLSPGDLPPDPIAVLGDTGSARIDALVHDLVEHSLPAGDIVQGERGRRGDGRAADVHVRQRLPAGLGAARARQDRARDPRPVRSLRRGSPAAARRRRRARGDPAAARDRLHRGHDRPLRDLGLRGAVGAGRVRDLTVMTSGVIEIATAGRQAGAKHESTRRHDMPAYAMAHLHNPNINDEVLEYLERIQATLDPYDGRFLVHGGDPEVLEGTWPGTVVIIEFPSADAARAWYRSDAYSDILALRTDNIAATR